MNSVRVSPEVDPVCYRLLLVFDAKFHGTVETRLRLLFYFPIWDTSMSPCPNRFVDKPGIRIIIILLSYHICGKQVLVREDELGFETASDTVPVRISLCIDLLSLHLKYSTEIITAAYKCKSTSLLQPFLSQSSATYIKANFHGPLRCQDVN